MKNKILFCFCLLFFDSIVGKAQDHVFYGINQVYDKINFSPKDLRTRVLGVGYTRDLLIKNTIRGYIALLHTSNSTVELFNNGEWKIADLEQMVLQKQRETKTSVVHISLGDKTNVLPEYGSVCRALCPPFSINLPHTTRCMFDEYTFDWGTHKDIKYYKVLILDNFNEVVKDTIVKNNKYTFKISTLTSENEYLFQIKVIGMNGNAVFEDKHNEGNAIENDPTKENLVKKQYDVLLKEKGMQEETLLRYVRVALFFEKHQYYLDAYNAYKKAYELSNKDTVFIKMLDYAKKRMSIGDPCKG